MQIKVSIEGSGIREMLERLQGRTGNLTPVLRAIGETVRTSVERNFEAQGRPGKWSPSQRVLRTGGQALSLTGRLRCSFSVKATGSQATVGTNVVYAAIHQMGGKTGKGHKATIPARPFMMVQDEDWAQITRQLADYITGGRR
jgi:phage virion morphogenesis protein